MASSRLRSALLLHAVLALVVVLVVGAKVMNRKYLPGGGDQSRYAAMGLNLADFGVLSGDDPQHRRPPVPGNGVGGPAIALELALVAKLSADTKAGMFCSIEKPGHMNECGRLLGGLRVMHILEVLAYLTIVWMIAYRIFQSLVQAWLVVALTVAVREVTEQSGLIMTEPLYQLLYGAFALALLAAWQEAWRSGLWLLTGVLLGLATMSKPTLQPLALALPLLALAGVRNGIRPGMAEGQTAARWQTIAAPAMAVCGYLLATGPIMLRNSVLLGVPVLADPTYLEAALSHRVAYNRMNWGEWARGWIYYLPDFGDNLSYALFGRSAVENLGFGPNGYYVWGRDVLHVQVHAMTAPAPATGLLIKTYVLGDIVKHAAVTALLFWRGLFVGGYVGLLALPSLVFAMLWAEPRVRTLLAILTVPAVIIAVLNAGASVSIVRYNLALVPVYAIALAWLLQPLVSRAVALLGIGVRSTSANGQGDSANRASER